MQYHEIQTLVETSIMGLKIDVPISRGDKQGQWSIKIKDSSVWIDAFDFPSNPGVFYVQVMSPLCAVPDKKTEEFAWDLLEINRNMYNCSMCKKDNWIYVISLREADGLGQAELDLIIDRVAFYSNDYYNKLSFKYQGCWLPKATNSGAPPGAV